MSLELRENLFENKPCQCNSKESLDYDEIPVITTDVPYDVFYEEYLLKNRAVVIKNVTNEWISSKKWVYNGELNYNYICKRYGNNKVTVYDCEKKYYNSQESKSTQLANFLVYWKSYVCDRIVDEVPLLYLKDWHLKSQRPDDDFYEVPIYFKSDWLNEYLTENGLEDYRFVYIGPKGSWTPFHSDVFKSFSWSANVNGQKKWIILPPGEENLLKDSLGNLPYDIEPVKHKIKHFEITQNKGDAIFVPTGWYHQVLNVENTISVNHNWVNACNIKNMWLDMQDHIKCVKNEIDFCKECDDFDAQVQTVFKANYGLDYLGFYNFIAYIGRKRLRMMKGGEEKSLFGLKHVLYDLKCVKEVLDLFIIDDDVKSNDELQDRINEDNLTKAICDYFDIW